MDLGFQEGALGALIKGGGPPATSSGSCRRGLSGVRGEIGKRGGHAGKVEKKGSYPFSAGWAEEITGPGGLGHAREERKRSQRPCHF